MEWISALLVLCVICMTCGLLPMKALRLKFGTLLAADAATLAPAADANVMVLFMNDIQVNEDLVAADLTEADFTGYAEIAGAVGGQQVGVDPVTGDQVITILAPAGGYRWECTGAPAEPQPIYGYALMNEAKTTLLAATRFDVPITVANVGDFIDIGAVAITMVLQPAS